MSSTLSKEEILDKHIRLELNNKPEKAKFWIGLAMDEYAKQQSIGFDEWKIEQGYEWDYDDKEYRSKRSRRAAIGDLDRKSVV